ncbi:MmcQ/YjbR family DNA-binding protein [Fulvivirgaceae bacterium PWU4]|uniref:MmcQ/YjbR family DNA-binding protein n=1 Tax=Chryseosolibacter histidini TaxID=2782349 RepID=A0AAP2DM37_9BACT|nr:MmcQ/YjbR family DNA-binding protein [Chryseosolibacter histidini]MBT1698810.1 MmcQ/YjbR family DNA-binding protein [Chryseosolibacter histidini]
MSIEFLQQFCKSLRGTTEDVKWGHDLCFCVGGKMFCVTGLEGPFSASFKVTDDEFEELTSREGFEPAPYMARNKWVLVTKPSALKKKEWEHHVRQSYELVSSKLTKKVRKDLKIE